MALFHLSLSTSAELKMHRVSFCFSSGHICADDVIISLAVASKVCFVCLCIWFRLSTGGTLEFGKIGCCFCPFSKSLFALGMINCQLVSQKVSKVEEKTAEELVQQTLLKNNGNSNIVLSTIELALLASFLSSTFKRICNPKRHQ